MSTKDLLLKEMIKADKKQYLANHELGDKSIAELKAIAESEECFMGGCHSKYDWLKRIDSMRRAVSDWDAIVGPKIYEDE